jgi:hypothetical protein
MSSRKSHKHSHQHVFKTAGTGPRPIVVFGPPGCGVSTMIDVVANSTKVPCTIIPYQGKRSIPQIEEALEDFEVVFVDVDGGIIDPSDVQAMVDHGVLAAHAPGCLVRVYAEDDDVLDRNQEREDYVTREDLRAWSREVSDLERLIDMHGLAYVMVPNNDLLEAVQVLALRSNLTR